MKPQKSSVMFSLASLVILTACAILIPLKEEVAQTDIEPSATQVETAQDVADSEEIESVEEEAINPSITPMPTPLPSATPVPELLEIVPPVLSTELSHGCERRGPGSQPPKEEQLAIDFTLLDTNGNSYTLSELLTEKPVVLIFGSFT